MGAVYVFFGPVEPGDVDLDEADATLTGEDGDERVGWSVSSMGDLDDDGFDDLAVGAPLNDRNGSNAGAVYVVHGGKWLSGTTSVADANATLYGSEDDRAGWSVSNTTALPDNESGVLVGAPTDDDGGHEAGAVFIVGTDSLASNVSLEAEADA